MARPHGLVARHSAGRDQGARRRRTSVWRSVHPLGSPWTMAPPPLLASLLLAGLALLLAAGVAERKPHVNHGKFKDGPWTVGHATFYGGRDGPGTTDGGACGFKDALAKDYGRADGWPRTRFGFGLNGKRIGFSFLGM
ncbi:hypothetical protein PAHAL_1G371700 [Panicum hallii]|uniref:Uncharacterized protein n=1 Tax=Panicum hallii TaxID=206008 RepID=A0A2S3GSX7_9POAL|nr:uncharacterized protein LOC112875941 [Panicum hallii]PAN07904.1 hypothetical protein PAHAL_1G371700 [Panicum hallii]